MLTVEDEEKILQDIIKQLEDKIKILNEKIRVYTVMIEKIENETDD